MVLNYLEERGYKLELSNFEIWEKWLILLGGWVVIIYIMWNIDDPKEEEYLDVPDFIKGNAEDFYGDN